ncbi:MAG: response regulator transcription factor [Eubacteriaceae bacterium]|nr:response regulator transcription factor [Eubacteriaceae bacterium]
MAKILLAEDEKELQKAEVTVLQMSGYEVDAVDNGMQAVEAAKTNIYDCMVIDIMMPVMDGIEALKAIRASGNVTPVILLTAKAEIDDRITGLDAGADDYLTKPFAMKELLARIRSMTRRQEAYTPTKLSIGNVTLNTEQQELSVENAIRLANKESKLMEFLMLNAEKDVSTMEILNHVWHGDPEADMDIVWIYISYLRKKLESIDANIFIDGERDQSFILTSHEV